MRGLTTQPASELKFLLDGKDGAGDEMVTIVDYMKRKWPFQATLTTGQYNYVVKYPRMPCVQVSLTRSGFADCQYGNKNYLP